MAALAALVILARMQPLPSLQAPRSWLAWLGGLLAAAVAVLLLVDLKAPLLAPAPRPVPAASGQASPFGAGLPVAGPDHAPAPASADTSAAQPAAPATVAPPGAPPAGVTPEQWQQLQQALANHPAREAELARVGEYLAFQNRFNRFQQLRQQPDAAPAELATLARALDAELPQRLARRELGAGEARLLKMALLQVLQPDDTLRQAALAAWADTEARLAAGRTAPDPRDATWQQQQAAAVAAWQALPEAQRDPRALEQQLETLRQAIYGPGR